MLSHLVNIFFTSFGVKDKNVSLRNHHLASCAKKKGQSYIPIPKEQTSCFFPLKTLPRKKWVDVSPWNGTFLIGIMLFHHCFHTSSKKDIHWIYAHPATVSTRTITCFIANPRKPSFSTIAAVDPRHTTSSRKTNMFAPENKPCAPKGKNRLPTIHFQGRAISFCNPVIPRIIEASCNSYMKSLLWLVYSSLFPILHPCNPFLRSVWRYMLAPWSKVSDSSEGAEVITFDHWTEPGVFEVRSFLTHV